MEYIKVFFVRGIHLKFDNHFLLIINHGDFLSIVFNIKQFFDLSSTSSPMTFVLWTKLKNPFQPVAQMFSATIRKCTGIKYKLNNWNPGHTVQLACNTVHQLLCSLLEITSNGFHVVPIIPSRYYRVGSILTQENQLINSNRKTLS